MGACCRLRSEELTSTRSWRHTDNGRAVQEDGQDIRQTELLIFLTVEVIDDEYRTQLPMAWTWPSAGRRAPLPRRLCLTASEDGAQRPVNRCPMGVGISYDGQ